MRVGIVTLLGLLLARTWFTPAVISGTSMEPTLDSGSLRLVNRWAYGLRSPQRGDIVFLRSNDDKEFLVKRVLGLPGDEVKMLWGKVFINGVSISEPYRTAVPGWCMLPVTLREGEYWVIGDNRDVSSYHTVVREQIVGRFREKRAWLNMG